MTDENTIESALEEPDTTPTEPPAEGIAQLEQRLGRLAERVVALEPDGGGGRTGTSDDVASPGTTKLFSRRSVLGALGIAGLAGLGASTASADPQGQVGTQSDPLAGLYTTRVASPEEQLYVLANGYFVGTFANDGPEADVLLGTGAGTAGAGQSAGRTVGGGSGNVASGESATVGGGNINTASGLDATIGGGLANEATESGGTVAGGRENVASRDYAAIAGGEANEASGGGSAVGGGYNNAAKGYGSTVAGGGHRSDANGGNVAHTNYSTVGGGESNEAGAPGAIDSNKGATVGGGQTNSATAEAATIAGGLGNGADGRFATIPGGALNTANGYNSFAAGGAAHANDIYAFVWNDGISWTGDGFSSDAAVNGEPVTGGNTFNVGSNGGARFVTGSSTVTYIAPGSAGWSNTSTRAAKTNVESLDPTAVLEGVESLEIASWEYEDEDGEGNGEPRIGPFAEEFHDAFDVGGSDEHINSIDADGVAFGAIQGLAKRLDDVREGTDERAAETERRVEELEGENEALREENADLRAANDEIRAALADLEQTVAAIQPAAVAADGGEAPPDGGAPHDGGAATGERTDDGADPERADSSGDLE